MIALVYLRDSAPDGQDAWRCLFVLPRDRACDKARELARSFARIYVVWHDAATGQIVFYVPPSVTRTGRRPPVL